MKRVLITGNKSFIGGELEKRLNEFPGSYQVGRISLRGDDWKKADLSSYDVAVDVAAIVHKRYDNVNEDEYYRVNTYLAEEFAAYCKKQGVKHFIYMSSSAVYGDADKASKTKVIEKDTPLDPVTVYGKSKMLAEEKLHALEGDDFYVSIVRSPTVYGGGAKGAFHTISKYAKFLGVFSDAAVKRSVIYIKNLAECLRLIIDRDFGGTYFPQDPYPVSLQDFLVQVRAVKGTGTSLTGLFTPVIRFANKLNIMRKIFGGVVYAPELSEEPGRYRIYTFEEALDNIRAEEQDQK